ncbi:protein PTST homolog 3, chloroplastic [Lactuca sativa]|uniref:protein PTST homolog 3, chloroplastic n=1 Tax=Lactuca sativa TaxID=4236 RepID=UPI000CC366A9|nr:protein PTST homolog 3, chloroplastic [Lactuca sativa]
MISPMATQLHLHLPLPHSHFFLPSYKHFLTAAPEPRLCQFGVRHRRCLLVTDCASSPNETRVAGRKPARTNADLCNDLREFMSEAGLPDGHVPSLKELSHHGRQDLANLVRRRGYKLIKELLAASQEVKVNDSNVDETLTDNQENTNTEEDESTDLDENGTKLAEAVLLSNEETSTKSSLQEKVMKFIQSGELETIEDSANLANGSVLSSQLVNSTSQLRNISSNDQLQSAEDVEMRTKEDEAEINRIKVILHHKELELSQLKEQIEKNKEALCELQAKAETEINKAQKLVLDKDAELLAAEESLSGLKQVQVDYWGEGESVEVAGSFNGWNHGVKLDPQPSSNITDPIEFRNTRLWRSMLWLYPGIYEIKFIVDGKWMIDPMKEVVARGSIHNNVLRVDR